MSSPLEQTDRAVTCEVLVIGAGVAGYCAAIQAGRCGCKTVLIEKDEVLGGNSGPNLGVGITGAERYHNYGTELGILQEIREEACWTDARTHIRPGAMPYNISRRFEAVVQDLLTRAGVTVLKRHYARLPVMEGRRIQAVIVEDLASFETVRVEVSGCVIEASGDGEIAARAGADFDYGSESREEFGERSAPEQRNRLVQGTSLVAIAQHTGRDVPFVAPDNTPEFRARTWHGHLGSYLNHHGSWPLQAGEIMFLYVTEAGGNCDTVRDDGAIYEELLRQLWAEWDHIKNGPHREAARCLDLLWVSPKAGKRESRRFLGDHVLTQTDLEAGRCFEDDIAYGGHDLDEHRVYAGGADILTHSVVPMYGIPFRCCYSRNTDNLLLAGRLVSATHLAHSSVRVMGTGAAIGQAVGLAAALCLEKGCTPRELRVGSMEELQARLAATDGTIPGRPMPPGKDLARTARVTAESELAFNDQEPGESFPLMSETGLLLWDWPEHLGSVEVYLRNPQGCAQSLTLTVYRSRREPRSKNLDEFHQHGWRDLRDEAFAPLGQRQVEVPAGFEGWLRIPVGFDLGAKDPASDEDRVLLALSENPLLEGAVCARACEIAELVEHSHHSGRWMPVGHRGALRLHPAPRYGEAEQVTNGFLRRFSRGPMNLWLSDPDKGLPQDLLLSWDEPQGFTEVRLTFDTLHREVHDHPCHSTKRVSEMLVSDYEISVLTEAGWRELVQVSGNYHRRRIHSFPRVETRQLRLRVLATHGEGWGARVYEVEVFDRE